jgi:hypothetical protein
MFGSMQPYELHRHSRQLFDGAYEGRGSSCSDPCLSRLNRAVTPGRPACIRYGFAIPNGASLLQRSQNLVKLLSAETTAWVSTK